MIGQQSGRWLMAVACGTIVGCSDLVEGDIQQAQLDASRSRWQDAGIVDYQYAVEQVCICPGVRTATVEVQAGIVVAVTEISGGTVDQSLYDLYPTVEDLFDTIQDAMNQDPDILNVQYDAELGYPEIIAIDIRIGPTDDDLRVTTTDFVADP